MPNSFNATFCWPSGWCFQARLLMRAALKLLQDCEDANDRTLKRLDEEFERSMHGEQGPSSRTLEGQEPKDHYDSLSGPIGLALGWLRN